MVYYQNIDLRKLTGGPAAPVLPSLPRAPCRKQKKITITHLYEPVMTLNDGLKAHRKILPLNKPTTTIFERFIFMPAELSHLLCLHMPAADIFQLGL